MRHTTSVLATLLVALSSGTASVAQPASNAMLLSFLPPERVFPLDAEQCSCATFREGAALVDDAVIFSGTSNLGHMRVVRRDYELKHLSRKVAGKNYINIFGSAGVNVSLTTTEVPFEQACSAYPDPPAHGSCFVGTMRVHVGKRSTAMEVVQLCGC
jgi:hypothetical protein